MVGREVFILQVLDLDVEFTWVKSIAEMRAEVVKGVGAWGNAISLSGVNGDHLTSTTTHKEDPIETLCQDLQEFHI